MKVRKITDGIISIEGITFHKDVEVEVPTEVGTYIKSTFPSVFVVTEAEKKVTPKAKTKGKAKKD